MINYKAIKMNNKIILLLLCGICITKYTKTDYYKIESARNSILSPIQNMNFNENSITTKIIQSIYEPFNMVSNDEVNDNLDALVSAFNPENLKRSADVMSTETAIEVATQAINEELNLDTYGSVEEPMSSDAKEKKTNASMIKIADLIVKTVKIDLLNQFLSQNLEKTNKWTPAIQGQAIQDLLNIVENKLANLKKTLLIDSVENFDLLHRSMYELMTELNQKFIYQLAELAYLMNNPLRFLVAEYESLFIKSILESDFSSEKRLSWIVELMNKSNPESNLIDSLFSLLYNFKKENNDGDEQNTRFVTRCVQQLFKLHYQNTQEDKRTLFLRFFLIDFPVPIIKHTMSTEFLRNHLYENDLITFEKNSGQNLLGGNGRSMMKWMNLMKFNEHVQLENGEYEFIINHFELIDYFSSDKWEQMAFAHYLIANNLFDFSENFSFISEFYTILLEFVKINDSTKNVKTLSLAFDRFLDQYFQNKANKLGSSQYVFMKILNAVFKNFQSEPFDFGFVKPEKEEQIEMQDYQTFMLKNSDFAELVLKITYNKLSEKPQRRLSVSESINILYSNSWSSEEFDFSQVSPKKEEISYYVSLPDLSPFSVEFGPIDKEEVENFFEKEASNKFEVYENFEHIESASINHDNQIFESKMSFFDFDKNSQLNNSDKNNELIVDFEKTEIVKSKGKSVDVEKILSIKSRSKMVEEIIDDTMIGDAFD